ncbi:MAG: hypothetical protein K6E36_03415 [Oscillospiraceae bacterium]|jgi:hypothetical protein|nr:hypothetical protein [Oscillospiraceae bacterium]
MKLFRYLAVVSALLLTGCGNTNTQKIDDLIAAQENTNKPAAEQTETSAPPKPAVDVPDASNGEYDVDLTVLDSNMVYAQVYDMAFGETDYSGKLVRAKGAFNYYQDPQTNKEYFAVLISDATACCAQGIEFVLAGSYRYPDDYPAPGSEIVVHGTFNTYRDETGAYVQLKDAVLES